MRLLVVWFPEVPVQFGGVTVQEVAFVEDHIMFAEELYAMEQEPAEPLQRMEAVGDGAAPTFTVTDEFAFPPPLLHVMIYVRDAGGL